MADNKAPNLGHFTLWANGFTYGLKMDGAIISYDIKPGGCYPDYKTYSGEQVRKFGIKLLHRLNQTTRLQKGDIEDD